MTALRLDEPTRGRSKLSALPFAGSLDEDAVRDSIQMLSLMVGNPDMLWTPDNWIPAEIKRDVASTFQWSAEEVRI